MKFNSKLILIQIIKLVNLISNIQSLNYSFQAYTDLAFIRSILYTDDNRVVSVADNKIVKIWDPFRNWTLLTQFTNTNSSGTSAYTIAIVTERNYLIVGSWTEIKIWDINSTNCILMKTYNEHSNYIRFLTVSSNGLLASGASDNKIKIWNISQSNSSMTLSGHASGIYSLVFITNDTLASGSQDSTIKIWNLNTGVCLTTLLGHTGMVTSLILMPNNYLISGCADLVIKIWNITDNYTLSFNLTGHTGWISSMIPINENLFASCANDKTIKIWNISDFKLTQTLIADTVCRSVYYWSKFDILLVGLGFGYISIWQNIFVDQIIKDNLELTSNIDTTIEPSSTPTTNIDQTTKIFQETSTDSLLIATNSSETLITLTNPTTQIQNAETSSKVIDSTKNNEVITSKISTDIINQDFFSTNQSAAFNYGSLTSLFDSTTTQSILNTNYSNTDIVSSLKNVETTFLEEITTLTTQKLPKYTSTKSTHIIKTTDIYSISNQIILATDEQTTSMIKLDTIAETFISNIFVSSNSNTNMTVSFSFDSILTPTSLSSTSNNSINANVQLIIGLFTQIKYDITDCLSNCSNHGLCKLGENNKMKCECDLFYDGAKCDLNLRPCSKYPCLNSINCNDLIINELTKQFDFKCECKKNYFGKSCENKVNLCQNETCNGNGICKVENENQLNETIKCKCFGIEMYEGDKCQKKSPKLVIIQTTVKSSTYIAVAILCCLFLLIILSDIHSFITKTDVMKNDNRKKIIRKMFI